MAGQIAAVAGGGLDVYIPSAEKPWNKERVLHLYHRLGYGATHAEVQAALAMTPSQLVDQLLNAVHNEAAPAPPLWANYTSEDYENLGDDNIYFEHKQELRRRWIRDMIDGRIRSKLALFWHNHFVTKEIDYGCNRYMWEYYSLLHTRATGNFKTFVEEMGTTGAMLSFLNGNQNIASEPNENYARELMELFTMGENNGYTQIDIVNVARALTGWRCNMYECTEVSFDNNLFDKNNKTIFGKTGKWNYADVHNLIFTERREQVAAYIAKKIYKAFVYNKQDEEIVAGLAETFRNSNWELLPVFKQLFKSEHFFDDRVLASQVKSPLELLLGFMRSTDLKHETHYSDDGLNYLFYVSSDLNQELFNPPDVAGWPGYHSWVNENALTNRWSFSSDILYSVYYNEEARNVIRQLAIDLTNMSTDPVYVTQELIRHYLGRSLDPQQFNTAVAYFKADVPENYFQDGTWSLYYPEVPAQVINLMVYLSRLPEYQLV